MGPANTGTGISTLFGICVKGEPTAALPEITLDPPTDVNPAGTSHTVTATITAGGNPVPNVLVSFSVTGGPNVGQASDPGECSVDPNCNTDANGQVSWTYTSNGVVGTDTIVACFTDESGAEHCAEATKEWIDRTAPEPACTESVNPSGKKVPPAGSTTQPGSKGGQNEDAFWHLAATDNVDPDPNIFVVDLRSGSTFGPYRTSTTIKYTQAPGATPGSKPIGGPGSAVTAHITGKGDMGVYAVDAAGNTSATITCLVPPPPK